MPTIIIILVAAWIVYLGAGRLGTAQREKKRAMEKEIDALSAKKEEFETIIIQAEEDLAQKLEENRATVREEFQKSKQSLDEEIDGIRKQKLAQVEQEADANKMAAVNSLNHWVEQEKSRLKERLDDEYERKLQDLEKLK